VPRKTAVLLAVLAGAWLSGLPAHAQAPAWPGDSPGQQPTAAPAWPGDKPAGGAQASVAPAPTMAPPMAPMTPMAPMGAPPAGTMGAPNAQQQACAEEFMRMRNDVEKKGRLVKSANERKASREELCAALTGVHAAMGKWYNYVKKNATACGIPAEAGKDLGTNYANLSKLRKNVCEGGAQTAAAAPRTPSLSEALGTIAPATEANTTVRRGGTLDTLMGNPIR